MHSISLITHAQHLRKALQKQNTMEVFLRTHKSDEHLLVYLFFP